MNTGTRTGTAEDVTLAPIVEALHRTYDALTEHVRTVRNIELPRAVFVVQRDERAWGHITTRPAWESSTEVSGENLARGGREVFGTVAHEAAHAYNIAANLRDVDVNGRHNKIFRVAAESLFGLTIAMHAPNHWAGWTKTTVGLECAQRWAREIEDIDKAIRVASGQKDAPGASTGGGFGGLVMPPMPKGRDKNGLRATCGCGSIIRTSAKVLLKGVICGQCGDTFQVNEGR